MWHKNLAKCLLHGLFAMQIIWVRTTNTDNQNSQCKTKSLVRDINCYGNPKLKMNNQEDEIEKRQQEKGDWAIKGCISMITNSM